MKLNYLQRTTLYMVILAFILSAFIFFHISFFENIELKFFDHNMTTLNVTQNEEQIALIIVSDESLKTIGSWPFDRKIHGDLITNFLTKAKSVYFDMLFIDDTNKKSDDLFAEALKKSGNVVLDYTDDDNGTVGLMPLPNLLASVNYAGFANDFNLDTDNMARKFIYARDHQGTLRPSAVYAILSASGYDSKITNKSLILSKNGKVVSTTTIDKNLAFYRIAIKNSNYKLYEYSDVLNGKYPKNEFDNKIVLVGNTYTGSSDTIPTPTISTIGVKYIADSLSTVLSGKSPHRARVIVEIPIVFIIIGLLTFFTLKVQSKLNFIVPIAMILIVLIGNRLVLDRFNVWHESIYLLFGISLSYIITMIVLFFQKQLEINVHQLPLNAILNLNSKQMSELNFEQYIRSIENDIIKSSNLKIEEPVIDENHELYKQYLSEKGFEKELVSADNYIFIPLTNFAEDKRHDYCVLKSSGISNINNIKHVSALILSADVYFKSISENKEKNRLFYSVIESMVAAMDSKDSVTAGHSKRVAELSFNIGTWMKLEEEQLETLRFAAIIHDIGKLGVTDLVLNKPSFLSDSEFAEIQSHPSKGGDIIASINLPKELQTGILQHHERPDGRGYPLGLTAQEISPTANIIKVADVFDALVSERQYKRGWKLDRICELLYNGRGTEFDADVVDVLLENMKPEGWEPKTTPDDYNKSFPQFFFNCAKDILTIFKENNVTDIDTNPLSLEFDFTCDRRVFANMNYGEALYKDDFVYILPKCIYADDIKKVVYYTKSNIAQDMSTLNYVRNICYVFIRGFITAGIAISDLGADKTNFCERAMEELGNPTFEQDGVKVWDLRAAFGIMFVTESPEEPNYIVYVNKAISY